MKKLIYLLMSVFFLSCGNVLDVEPETAVTYTNYFNGEKDAAALLYNIMGVCVNQLLGYHDQEIVGMKVDIVNNTSYGDVRDWSPSSLLNTGPNWSGLYMIIYNCNLLLDNAYRFSDIDKDRLEFYCKQARFFKAYTYYELVRRWGDVPVNPSSSTTEKLGKTPKLEVLENEVIAVAETLLDLPVFADLKGEDGAALTSKQYASKGSVCALLANAYAWKAGLTGDQADWEKAEGYCTQLINGDAGYYALALDPQEVCEKVMHRGSDESIFEIEYTLADDQFYSSTVYPATSLMIGYPVDKTALPSKQTYLAISCDLVQEIYGDTINDRRVRAYFQFVEDDPVAHLKKWNFSAYLSMYGMEMYRLQDVNRIVWRLADIYLLRAECRARLGRADAEADLNKIRERAYGDTRHNYTATEGDIRMAIFRERERELLYEGHRYFDVMRNGYWKTELQGAFSIMTEHEFEMGAQYYPVPTNAFYMNDLMVENEYWLTKQ